MSDPLKALVPPASSPGSSAGLLHGEFYFKVNSDKDTMALLDVLKRRARRLKTETFVLYLARRRRLCHNTRLRTIPSQIETNDGRNCLKLHLW